MRKLTTWLLVFVLCVNLIPVMSHNSSASPPTSNDGRIQKMSICYSGHIDGSGVKQFLAEHFDLVDTAFGYNTIVQWIKENAINPDVKVIGYRDALNGGEISTYPEDYYIHATDDKRIRLTGLYPGNLMNPHLRWKDYSLSQLQSTLTTDSAYDGTFVDDFSYNLESQSYGPYSIDHPYSEVNDGYSITNWGGWMMDFASTLRNGLPGKFIMVNCHRDYYPGAKTGAMLFENFIHSDTDTVTSNGMSFSNGWNGGLLAVDCLHAAAEQGAVIATHSGCSGGTLEQKQHWAEFCYAMLSFAAVNLSKTYYTWMFYGQDTTNGYWQFTDDIILGNPVGDYTKIGTTNVYYREFSNYYVLANLDNLGTYKTFTFTPTGQTFTSFEGKHAVFIEKSPSPNLHFVSTSGNDNNPGDFNQPWRTIQKAVNTVTPGDTVYIRGGTYHEKVTFKNVQGTPDSWITFKPHGNEAVVVDAYGLGGTYDGILQFDDGCRYIRITGIEVKGTCGHGVFLHGGEITNLRIDHCVIHDCESSAIYCYSSGQPTKYVRNIEFDNNTIYDVNNGESYSTSSWSPQEAISFSNVQGFNIHHNIVREYGKEGIDVKSGSSNGQIHHNTINTSLASPAFQWDYNHIGIYVDGYHRVNKNIRIYCNMITGYGGSGIVLNAERPELGGGIQDISVFNNVVALSVLLGHTEFRSLDSLDDCPWTNVSISCNTFYNKESINPPRIFPSATHITHLVIQNNIFAGVSSALISFQNTASTEAAGRIILANNLFYRLDGPVHNQWKDGVDQYWGTQNIRSDPKFVSVNDLHLQSSSPAIDNGRTVNIPSDFDGKYRPYGAGFDIGAYEYHTPMVVYPWVITDSASMVGETSAILNGYLGNGGMLPDGCSVCFEYGTTTSYGTSTPYQTRATGQGFSHSAILLPATTYHYRAVAYDGVTFAYGSDEQFTTEAYPTPVQPPSNLQGKWTTQNSIYLSWTNGPGAAYTFIVRKIDAYPTSISDGSIVYIGIENSYNDTGLVPLVRYFYRAFSYGSNQLSPGVSFIIAQTQDTQKYGSAWAEFPGYLTTDKSMATYFEYSTSPWFTTMPGNFSTTIEYDEQTTPYYYNFFGPHWVGQTFTVDNIGAGQRFSVHNVSFKLFRINSPGMIYVSLYNTNETGLPTGPVLATGSLDGRTLLFSNSWVTIPLSANNLSAYAQYAVILNVSGSAADFLYLGVDLIMPTYTRGKLLVSHDGAATFSSLEADACFRIWGTIQDAQTTAQTIHQSMSSSGYCNVTQNNLTAGQMYWYSHVAEDAYGTTTRGAVRTLLTNPEEPMLLSLTPSPENKSVLVCWSSGEGANRTILLKGDSKYPETPFEGTEIYNGTNTCTWVPDMNMNSTSYYSLCSVTTWGNLSRYNTLVNILNKISSNKIVNSKGYSWPASGEYIQVAIDNLNGAGDVWLPAATLTLSSITIKHDGVKIHGQGPENTILRFTGSNFGILVSENPSASGNEKFRWGLQNLQFDNFTFSGGAMWVVIRKGLLIQNVAAEDIQRGYAAIRVICPYGNDNNGDGWSDSTGHYWSGSTDAVMEDVRIINCHTNRTSSHGFALWSTDLKGILYKNILFNNCSATQGGYGSTNTGTWSVGFNFGEVWNVAHEVDEARIQNLTVKNCEAYENWESGFHIENKIRKTNVYFTNCVSNNNGQKYLKTNNDDGEAWNNPYGAGFLFSYKANPNDNNMVFTSCVANGNGAWGYRGSATPYPTFIDCSGNEYPSYSQGNGRWTIPNGAPGGLSRMCGNIL